jgi:hypothetical protein
MQAQQPTYPVANLSTLAHQTAGDRIAFLHAAAGYPVVSTWLKAIAKGYFTTWPGLTVQTVKRHMRKSIITAMGHQDQQRSNRQSTKSKSEPNKLPSSESLTRDEDTDDFFPSATLDEPHPEERTHNIFASCEPITGKIFSDLPGKFIVPSNRGYNYLLIVYDYDTNAILAEPMKNRTANSIVKAFETLHGILVSRGFRPKLQRLDNEAAAPLRHFLDKNGIDWQLVPPKVHRRNSAERAIRTYKKHFIACLCGADPAFPLALWCRTLQQTELTLNLLRGSRVNPQLSSYAQLHGAFDFNRTPLGPVGCKIAIHQHAEDREAYGTHAVPGWYLGPAKKHYRCYRVFVSETGGERNMDTLDWFPAHTPLPKTSSIDAAIAAASDLTEALLQPSPASPLCGIDTTSMAALRELASYFNKATKPTPVDATIVPPSSKPDSEPVPRVELPADTYASRTQNPGVRRRNAARLLKTATPTPSQSPVTTPPIAPRVTPTPIIEATTAPKLAPTITPPPAPATSKQRRQLRLRKQLAHMPIATAPTIQHSYNTRSQKHQANHTTILPDYLVNAVLDEHGVSQTYRKLLQGNDKAIWENGSANEFGRLAQGRDGTNIKGTDTIHFIRHSEVPTGRKATYARFVVDIRPQKDEPNRVRLTVGGNLIEYLGNVSTPTADMTTAKLVINSVLSTIGATYCCFDISNFYLNTPMSHYEYMKIPVWAIPECIMEQYNLAPLIHNGHVMVEIRKGMYGLPQAGLIAYERLVKHLATYGYCPARHTDGLWTHKTRPILFSLVVDDFGVKTVGKEHADHLLAALRDLYSVTVDWTGGKYLGLTLKWDYAARTCDVSMPDYIATALHRFQHPHPTKPEDSPHRWNAPNYGSKIQLSPLADTSPALAKDDITRIQQVVGTLLYYARAVDSTMFVALGTLAAAQSQGTEATAQALTQLLNYAATHPNAVVRYYASGMVLYIHSDASYNSEPKARSRVGGHFFLSDKPKDPSQPPTNQPKHNGAVHTVSSILKNVMSSATEAEFAGLFHNARDGASLRTTLIEMGHPQPPTPIQTDNSTAAGITNGTVRQRKSKAMDMRFYWVQDRVRQKQFLVYWRQGSENLGDYFTKHHSTAHHRIIRPTYLHVAKQANALVAPISPSRFMQGCVHLTPDSYSGFPFSPTKPTLSATQLSLTNSITS